MQIGTVGSAPIQTPVRADPESVQSVLVARKALDQAKVDGQQSVELIQSAGPAGTGTRVNLLA